MKKTIFFLFYLLSHLSKVYLTNVENLKTLDDIIISEDELKIFSLDEYFTNSNLKFSVTNPYSNIFKITLSESFNNLVNMEVIENSQLMQVKSLPSIQSFVLLFENTLMVIRWNQINSIITAYCSKAPLYSIYSGHSNYLNGQDCNMKVNNPSKTTKCYDFVEIFIKEFSFSVAYILIDCDITDTESNTKTQNFFFYTIIVSTNKPRAYYYNANTEILNYPEYLNSSRNLLYYNESNWLYRFSPFSSKQNPENTSVLQIFSSNSLFRFNFLGTVPNVTQYIEKIRVINGTLLILDYISNIFLFNICNGNYTDHFNIPANQISIDITYYQNRLFILTNDTVYRFSFSSTLTFKLIFQINITEEFHPNFITQTQDYIYVSYPKFLKIMRNDDTSPKKMLESVFYLDFMGSFNRNKLLLKLPEQFIKNTLALWTLQSVNINDLSYKWSFNITQIQKKVMFLSCCNNSNFDKNSSMQQFYFNLTINDANITVNIYYWNLNDYHLYSDPSMKNAYNDKQQIIYSFDSENILIPYTSWVMGPLKKVQIHSVQPPCEQFVVDCYKTFNVSFEYLRTNQNVDLDYNSLVLDSIGLNFTMNSTLLTIYWQKSKDLSFYIIDCFLSDSFLIEDCIISFRKYENNFRFKSVVRYNSFHIINAELLYFAKSTQIDNADLNSDEIYLLTFEKSEYGFSCLSIYLYEKENLLFCLNSHLQIFLLEFNKNILYFSNSFNFTDNTVQNSIEIYPDFIELYNCLIISAFQKLNFYEIIFPLDENFQFTINLKTDNILPKSSDVHLINLNFPLVIIIDYEKDEIKEYTLRNLFILTYLRSYPTFEFNIQSSFKCNERFICFKIIDFQANYLLVYNVTEPTSKLLRYKISYDLNNDKIYPVITNEVASNSLYHNLFRSSSVFIMINPEGGVSIKLNKVCDINANIPEIFQDPTIIDQQYYQYTIYVSFTNDMMKEMIFFQIIVNISLLNSVIKLNQHNETIINFIDPPSIGSRYVLNLTDSPFVGPVQNYKIYSDFFSKINDYYYYNFYPFIEKTLDFEEDYTTERKFYGDFIKVGFKDGILIVLSENNLTFHDTNNGYAIIYFVNPNLSCTDMQIHSSMNLIYLFCWSFNFLHLKSYEFNSTTINYNNKTSVRMDLVLYNDSTPFKDYFQDFIVVAISESHLFFLVDEGYYPELHKKKKTIYIFDLPMKLNNYSSGHPCMISDQNFMNRDFVMSEAVDIQISFIKNILDNYFYMIYILMNKNLEIIKFNFTSEVLILNNYTIEFENFTKTSYNTNYVFYTVTLLDFTLFNSSTSKGLTSNDFSVTYMLSSNLHIYEFNTTIKGENLTTVTNHIFTKYYSCIFTESVRPRKFKNFLGSFCTKIDVINGVTQNGFNYFVLHKVNQDKDLLISPVLALPIYLKNYNFKFITKKNNYTDPNETSSVDCLILPSFSSLFSEFEISYELSLFLRKDQNALSTKLIAYNEISNASIYINIILSSEEKFEKIYIILICVFSGLFVIGVLCLSVLCIKKRKKKMMQYDLNEAEEIDDEYLKSRIGNFNGNNDGLEPLQKKNGKESTSFGSHMKANSFVRLKLKNAKWIE